MWYVACGLKNWAYNNRVSATSYVQSLVHCCMRYMMRKKWIATCHDSCSMWMRIRMVNPENDITDQGFSLNVGSNSSSVMMPSSKVSTENTENFIELVHQHPSVFDASHPERKFLKSYKKFLKKFFTNFKLYAIAISIKSFCSISKRACCNTN